MSRRVLLVDAANVVGSRPDGWWRDRPGAARRLVDALVRWADTDAGDVPDEIVVVLEGSARRGVPRGEPQHEVVRVVHAPKNGDDEVVAQTVALVAADPQAELWVVTADRELRARVAAAGATAVGPGWLWERVGRGSAMRQPTVT